VITKSCIDVELRNQVVLVATIYRPPNASIVYHSLDVGDYGLQALDEIYWNLLPLYGYVYLLGDFNADLLDPGHSLFPGFLDFLEILCNVAIFRTRGASGKLLNCE
jgi:hypothetical protein